MALQLVHLGSWGNDIGRPPRERIGALEVRDISSYGSNSLVRILDSERPDVVVFLSTSTFAHRALVRYCRQRFIPTLLVYHGLVSVQVTDDSSGSYKVNPFAWMKFVSSRLRKTVTLTLPCYIGSLIRTGADMKSWIRFASDVAKLAIGRFSGPVANDGKTDKCAVYTDADIENAVRNYGFNAKDVIAVGNPDLIRFRVPESMISSRLQRPQPELENIMYIETGMVGLGLFFASAEDFVHHLITTSRALAAQGKRLCFKPHPAQDRQFLERELAGTGVELLTNEQFVSRLSACAACIVETSTLAVLPALVGIPLLLARYGRLEQLRFGPVLTSYPRAHVLTNLAEVSAILTKDASTFDAGATAEWIRVNAGPLPFAGMPDRVAEIVGTLSSAHANRSGQRATAGEMGQSPRGVKQ